MFRQINVHSIQDLEAVQESPLIARLVSKKRDRSDQLKALQHYKAMALEYLEEKYGSWPPPTTPPSQPEQPNDVEKLADRRAVHLTPRTHLEAHARRHRRARGRHRGRFGLTLDAPPMSVPERRPRCAFEKTDERSQARRARADEIPGEPVVIY